MFTSMKTLPFQAHEQAKFCTGRTGKPTVGFVHKAACALPAAFCLGVSFCWLLPPPHSVCMELTCMDIQPLNHQINTDATGIIMRLQLYLCPRTDAADVVVLQSGVQHLYFVLSLKPIPARLPLSFLMPCLLAASMHWYPLCSSSWPPGESP